MTRRPVDCGPGRFHGLETLVGFLRVGGLYVVWSSGLVVGARI